MKTDSLATRFGEKAVARVLAQCTESKVELGGALGEIRTPDPQIRSLVLYPAELRAPAAHHSGFAVNVTEAGGVPAPSFQIAAKRRVRIHKPCAGVMDSGFLAALGPGMTTSVLTAHLRAGETG